LVSSGETSSAPSTPETGSSKKCLPGTHKWERQGIAGIMFTQFVDRCAKCRWWKVYGVDFGGSWQKKYPPAYFVVQRNKRTKHTRIVSADQVENFKKKARKWRWQKKTI